MTKAKKNTLLLENKRLRKKLVEQEQTSSERIAQLEHRVCVLSRIAFGPSSEKKKVTSFISGNPNQQHLFLADILADAERIAEETGTVGHLSVTPATPGKGKRKGRRSTFPDHLPVVNTEFELPEDQQRCPCGGKLHLIGFEESQELERIETTIVKKTRVAKYCCRC